METVREVLRWLEARWKNASTGVRIFYLLVIAVAVVLVLSTLPITTLWELFRESHPTAQVIIFCIILLMVVMTSIFAWERGHRTDVLKQEKAELETELNATRQALHEKDEEIRLLEARWEKLTDVEARENLWSREIAVKPTPFVDLFQRGTKTRFLALLNLKGVSARRPLPAIWPPAWHFPLTLCGSCWWTPTFRALWATPLWTLA
jgi:hypothetical protein